MTLTLTLALFFILFAWLVWSMYKTTLREIGYYEPIVESKSFSRNERQHFLNIWQFLFIFIFLLNSTLFFRNPSPKDVQLVALGIILMFAIIPSVLLWIDIHYWKITENVVVRLDPTKKAVFIKNTEILLSDIKLIEIHRNSDANLFSRYGYYRIVLKNGNVHYFNRIIMPQGIFDTFFKDIKQTTIEHYIAWIK